MVVKWTSSLQWTIVAYKSSSLLILIVQAFYGEKSVNLPLIAKEVFSVQEHVLYNISKVPENLSRGRWRKTNFLRALYRLILRRMETRLYVLPVVLLEFEAPYSMG